MKPVRLTIQAFGPYPGRQVIDFREAVQAGVFGIYGQTGSGKSTLFSAMTFALFGQPANIDQDAVSLRSDHAPADLRTEVEFVFDVGGRRYVALRRPEQTRPSRRGGGETRDRHEAYLFDATGLPLEEITSDRPGKVIAEKKVGLVNAAIIDRLGYGEEQFRQIVLLPQGRFEAFLSAKTPQRVEILRDLFDVSLYRRLAESLKTQADAARQQVQQQRAVYAQRLAVEGFETDDALKVGIAGAEEQHAGRVQALTEATEAAQAAQTALLTAEKTEALFVAAEQAQQALMALQARSEGMDALALRLEQVRLAQSLTDVESAARTAKVDRQAAEVALTRMQTAAGQAAEAARAAAERWAEQVAQDPLMEQLRRQVDDLARHRRTLDQAADVLAALQAAQKAEQDGQRQTQEAQATLDRLRERQRQRSEALKQARQTEARRADLLVRRQALQQGLKQATDYASAQQDRTMARQAVTTGQADRDRAYAALTDARRAMERAEQGVLHRQALHLASRLTPGAPCPVCGGQDHPAPARGGAETGDPVAALKQAEAVWQRADQAARTAEQGLASALSVLAERETRLSQQEAPDHPPETLRQTLKTLDADLAALGPVTDLSAAEAVLEREAGQATAAEERRDHLRDALTEQHRALTVLLARRDALLETVPEPIRDPAALQAALQAVETRLETMVKARHRAESALQAAREADLGAAKDVQAAQQTLADRLRRQQEAEGVFGDRLAQAGLTPEAYQALMPDVVRLAADQAMLEAFRRDVAGAGERSRQTAAAVEGVTRPDLSALSGQAAQMQADYRAAQEQEVEARQRRMALIRLRDSLADVMRDVEALEAQTASLRGIAEAVNGKNPHNLTLEIYAIAAMFEAVLQAANLRLGPMTGHRYQLVRDAEGGGRAQRGLGIQVFDAHTGKDRPTATLSGGETFIAALALALGLADVVESTSGRVQLDTIFIDEGFGSLDTEHGTGTLDQVLQVLNTLVSQNRAVGLISHVPLVQEAIPNGFYIRKQPGGSRVEVRGMSAG